MSKFYPGDSFPKTYTFTDDGSVFDPTVITATVYNPAGEVEAVLGLDNFEKLSIGVYKLHYNLPVDAAAGSWVMRVVAEVPAEDIQTTAEFPFSVSTQPYGALSVVKHLCSIEASDMSKDGVVLVFMEKATSFVNEALVKKKVTLPLNPVPDAVASIAEFYAAGLFLQKDSVDEKPHPHRAFAEQELAKFGVHRSSAGKVAVSAYTEIRE